MTQIITSTQFASKKQEAMDKQPLRKQINLGDIKFLTSDTIQYAGLTMGLTKTALRDLCNLVGVSAKMNTTVKSIMGEDFTKTLLNMLKDAISSKSGLSLTMVTGRDKIIRRFLTKSEAMISNASFFDMAEGIISANNLDVTTFDVTKDGGVTLNTISPKGGFEINGFSDEVFDSGLSMSNALTGVQMDPYIHRLVCTNGMRAQQFSESIKMKNLSPDSMLKFYESLRQLQSTNFQPMEFTNKLNAAMNTKASVAELMRGIDMIKSASNIDDAEIHKFIPYQQTKRDYQRCGLELNKLNHEQQKNAKTNLNVWDVINGVTDFASHDYGYEFKDGGQATLQMNAGNMLCKDQYDTANLVLNQPY